MKIPDTESENKKMQELYELSVQRIARSSTTVLISGESGTGKERMANLLQYHSPRSDKPYIKVNCAALPESVLESELFGHEKGAFTGAESRRIGRFEAAHTGTIFLDEIADLTLNVQSKLLRVIQEREIERVGGTKTIGIDVRIIAATNKTLSQEVSEGRFREDLYYRLNVIAIEIPALRDRPEDILPLTDKFINKFCEQNQRDLISLSTEAAELFQKYKWLGNVRELENIIERLTVLLPRNIVTPDVLPPELTSVGNLNSVHRVEIEGKTLREAKADFEKQVIEDTLAKCKGNVSASSSMLGIARKNLQGKIKSYGIEVDRFRGGNTDTEA